MMKLTNYTLLFLLTFSFNALAKKEYKFTRDLSIDANNIKSIFVDVGAGNLDIRGGLVDEIQVFATIKSTNFRSLEDLRETFDDKMILSLDKKRSQVILKSMHKKRFFSFSNQNIAVDLKIIIPDYLKVEIDDGSGSIHVSGIQNSLFIDDGSGSMVIRNIGGDVEIDDGSGNTTINDVDGDIYIDDGSGTIKINGVTGDVKIDDGSGSIIINNMLGRLKMVDDGSGNVVVNGVRQSD